MRSPSFGVLEDWSVSKIVLESWPVSRPATVNMGSERRSWSIYPPASAFKFEMNLYNKSSWVLAMVKITFDIQYKTS